MNDVATSGRTVLFVSHNMAAVEGLCTTAIHLEQGRLIASGETREIISRYLQFGAQVTDEVDLRNHSRRSSGAETAMEKLRFWWLIDRAPARSQLVRILFSKCM